MRKSHDHMPSSRLIAISLVVTLLGGAILAMGFVARMPDQAIFVGIVLFLAGAASVGVSAVLDARRSGDGLARALRRGFRTALSWGAYFLP
jgi:hypothetical protein